MRESSESTISFEAVASAGQYALLRISQHLLGFVIFAIVTSYDYYEMLLYLTALATPPSKASSQVSPYYAHS